MLNYKITTKSSSSKEWKIKVISENKLVDETTHEVLNLIKTLSEKPRALVASQFTQTEL